MLTIDQNRIQGYKATPGPQLVTGQVDQRASPMVVQVMEDTDCDGKIESSLESRGRIHRSNREVGITGKSSARCPDIGLTRVETEIALSAKQFHNLASSTSNVQNAVSLCRANVFGNEPNSGPMCADQPLKGRIDGWNRQEPPKT
jgi:hypothetical protein